MPEADFSGPYLTPEIVKEGDIVEIKGAGEYVEKEVNGVKKKILDLPVEANGVQKTYSPRYETGQRFVKAWGKATENWTGKKFKVVIVNYKAFGETKQAVEGEPIIAENVQ